jgi:hypothetical protein
MMKSSMQKQRYVTHSIDRSNDPDSRRSSTDRIGGSPRTWVCTLHTDTLRIAARWYPRKGLDKVRAQRRKGSGSFTKTSEVNPTTSLKLMDGLKNVGTPSAPRPNTPRASRYRLPDGRKEKAPHRCEAVLETWLPETDSNRRPSD